LSRAAAVREAATRAIDRLYAEFVAADHAVWDRIMERASEPCASTRTSPRRCITLGLRAL
jgi:hypothetical protein